MLYQCQYIQIFWIDLNLYLNNVVPNLERTTFESRNYCANNVMWSTLVAHSFCTLKMLHVFVYVRRYK